jgi:hypothetical protein
MTTSFKMVNSELGDRAQQAFLDKSLADLWSKVSTLALEKDRLSDHETSFKQHLEAA